MGNPKVFPFLELPAELREKIYILVCKQETTIALHTIAPPVLPGPAPKHNKFTFPDALLQTCSQIYTEVRPLYFKQNTFSIKIVKNNIHWKYFFEPSFLDKRREICNLEVILIRSGSHNFFTKEFLPAIEDCILNGRLRNLEFVIGSDFFRDIIAHRSEFHHKQRAERSVAATPKGSENHATNWLALKRVMLDPYLERRTITVWSLSQDRSRFVQKPCKPEPEVLTDNMAPNHYDVTWLLDGSSE